MYSSYEAYAHSQMLAIIKGGAVRRYHNTQVPQQSVAEHSHGVAMWVWVLTGGACGVKLLMAALTHDLAESELGDIPAPTKRLLNIRDVCAKYESAISTKVGLDFESTLSKEDKRILGLADALDGMLYCARNYRTGNMEAVQIYLTFCQYYKSLEPREGVEQTLYTLAQGYFSEFDV